MIKTWAVMSFPARISISPTAYRGEGGGGGSVPSAHLQVSLHLTFMPTCQN